MPVIDFHKKEVNFKIVYYGPGLSGKTTNIQHIHKQIKPKFKGKLVSLATQTDRTLFFDFLPMELGEMGGYTIRLHLYTVPGQVHYNATRKLVLKGVDGVVFVADSQSTMKEANIESLLNLEKNLQSHGKNLKDIPHLIQGNKRDLDDLTPMEDLRSILNRYGAPMVEAIATQGPGVLDTLREVVTMVIKSAKDQLPDAAGGGTVTSSDVEINPAAVAGVASGGTEEGHVQQEPVEEYTATDEQLAESVVVMSEEAESAKSGQETPAGSSPQQTDDIGEVDSRVTDGTILDLEIPIPGGGNLELKLGVVARVLKSSVTGTGVEPTRKVELTVKPLQARMPDQGGPPEVQQSSKPDEMHVEELTDPIEEPGSEYDPTIRELEISDPAESAGTGQGSHAEEEKRGLFGLFSKRKK